MKLFKFWLFLIFVIGLPNGGTIDVVLSGETEELDMVLIPSGEFLMGTKDDKGRPDEYPQHKIYLGSFYLDRFEATGEDFQKYLSNNPDQHPTIVGWWGRQVRPEMKKRPVIGLSWKRCNDYCEWKGKRLPTEAEWERAAAGLEGRKYPWGSDTPNKKKANFNRCCFIMKGLTTSEVGSYLLGATPEGIYDLAGNIAEWVYDWYDKNYYKNSEYSNPRGPKNGTHRTIRGGAWNSLSGYIRSSARFGFDEAKDFYGIGCRCAKSLNK